MPNFQILSEEEISTAISSLPDWSVVDNQLTADFKFSDFKTAFSFITRIAIESEVMNHHPEWSNTYNKVSFAFCTHDAGNVITDLDTKMAEIISRTAQEYS